MGIQTNLKRSLAATRAGATSSAIYRGVARLNVFLVRLLASRWRTYGN